FLKSNPDKLDEAGDKIINSNVKKALAVAALAGVGIIGTSIVGRSPEAPKEDTGSSIEVSSTVSTTEFSNAVEPSVDISDAITVERDDGTDGVTPEVQAPGSSDDNHSTEGLISPAYVDANGIQREGNDPRFD
ncbi:hypothetical protein KDA11_05410, partial [Candidatus Saccharibacteria bacterium]|nr:hypothetical protein [Candidatus Saccharibacteria bacterium]